MGEISFFSKFSKFFEVKLLILFLGDISTVGGFPLFDVPSGIL
jgi:hypothetical protein